MSEFLADAGEDHQGECEAKGRGEGEDDALEEWRAVLAVQLGHAEDGAVCGDERQEDAQGGVQRRHETLHRDVDELHKRGDHEDERERVDVAEAGGLEDEVVQQPGDGRGDGHHEDDGARHAQCRLGLLRDAKEGTATQKTVQHEVVDQNRADDDDEVVHGRVLYHSTRVRELSVSGKVLGRSTPLARS